MKRINVLFHALIFIVIINISVVNCSSIKSLDNNFQIILKKNSYTKYEPIPVLLEYINRTNSVDTLYNFMFDIQENLIFNLVNENNEKIKEYSLRGVVDKVYMPLYYILPGDTIITGTNVSAFYGELQTKYDSIKYFHQSCYIIPGKYTLQARTSNKGNLYISNTLTFEVKESTDEEKEMLNLLSHREYSSLFEKFPVNNLTESVYADYLCHYYPPNFDSARVDDSVIKNIYRNFWNNYPDSYYNTGILVGEYFYYLTLSTDSLSEIIGEWNYCRDYFKSGLISRMFNNEPLKERIIKSSEDTRKSYKFYLKNKK